jgi:hypothetical protein
MLLGNSTHTQISAYLLQKVGDFAHLLLSILILCYELVSCREHSLGTLLLEVMCVDNWNGFWPLYSLRQYIKEKFGTKNNNKPNEKDNQKEDSPP